MGLTLLYPLFQPSPTPTAIVNVSDFYRWVPAQAAVRLPMHSSCQEISRWTDSPHVPYITPTPTTTTSGCGRGDVCSASTVATGISIRPGSGRLTELPVSKDAPL